MVSRTVWRSWFLCGAGIHVFPSGKILLDKDNLRFPPTQKQESTRFLGKGFVSNTVTTPWPVPAVNRVGTSQRIQQSADKQWKSLLQCWKQSKTDSTYLVWVLHNLKSKFQWLNSNTETSVWEWSLRWQFLFGKPRACAATGCCSPGHKGICLGLALKLHHTL